MSIYGFSSKSLLCLLAPIFATPFPTLGTRRIGHRCPSCSLAYAVLYVGVLSYITMLSFIFYKYFTDFHRRLRFGTTSLVVPLCFFFHVFTLHRCVTCHFINFTFHRFHLLGFYMNLRTYENASIYTCVLFSDVSCDNTYW